MRKYSADALRLHTPEEVEAFLASLSYRESLFLQYDWNFWARDNQLIPFDNANPRTPDGSWSVWLAKCGRGWGKTRVGAETVRKWVGKYDMVNLIGATADDARDIMIQGESGILAICPKWERPKYEPSKRCLSWPNGAKSLIFTADEPDRLRGKQSMKVWADEVAAWRYREAWDQMLMGLRLGDNPQVVATSTPRNTPLIKDLLADPNTLVTHGTTYENEVNLSPKFYSHIIKKYEGTRLGRQELSAEMIEDNPGSLWNRDMIDRARLAPASVPKDLLRKVVGVDPAVTSGEESDETGIVVAAVDGRETPHFYVFDDASIAMASPDQWAARVVAAYNTWHADRVIGEVNNGGDLVETVIRHKAPSISYRAVRASHGKIIRAEPIAALFEQGRVHLVGYFPQLEDQLCSYYPGAASGPHTSPDRMDAMVWALTELSGDIESPEPVVVKRKSF